MRTSIGAVYDDDLTDLLDGIGELGRVRAGKARCASCGSAVTLESIFVVFPEAGTVKYICHDAACRAEVATHGHGRRDA